MINFTNSIGIEFVLVTGGKFVMGSCQSNIYARDNEKPSSEVYVAPFYISKHQITQREYKAVMGFNPSYFSPEGRGCYEIADMKTDNFPVESVSWEDANGFCEKLSDILIEKQHHIKYMLPTEEQWEFACNHYPNSLFNTGNSLTSFDANILGAYPLNQGKIGISLNRPTEVGQYDPNEFGIYDMHGNIWEWCKNEYYLYSNIDVCYKNIRVLRGGSWNSYSRFCRSAYRCIGEHNTHYYDCGIRLVCSISTY